MLGKPAKHAGSICPKKLYRHDKNKTKEKKR